MLRDPRAYLNDILEAAAAIKKSFRDNLRATPPPLSPPAGVDPPVATRLGFVRPNAPATPAARDRGSKMPDPGQRPVGDRAHRMVQGRRGWLAGVAGDGPGVMTLRHERQLFTADWKWWIKKKLRTRGWS